jgi:hypothetical protein
LIAQCLLLVSFGVALFLVGAAIRLLAPIYWVAMLAGPLDRFTLMLHCTSHRPLFKARYRWLNLAFPWVVGPFFGQTFVTAR